MSVRSEVLFSQRFAVCLVQALERAVFEMGGSHEDIESLLRADSRERLRAIALTIKISGGYPTARARTRHELLTSPVRALHFGHVNVVVGKLIHAQIHTVGDLTALTYAELAQIEGLTIEELLDIVEKIHSHGLSFAGANRDFVHDDPDE